jgi:hypothetical protein
VRFLFLIQGKSIEDHPGYHDACLRLLDENLLSAYMPFCYYGDPTRVSSWEQRWESLLHEARLFAPDLVLCHFFHGPIKGTRILMDGLRSLPCKPTIASSCGDPFVPGFSFHNFPNSLRESTRAADLSFFSQMGAGAAAAAKWGARNIILWPHGLCQKRFKATVTSQLAPADFDVVFIGSHTAGRNPLSSITKAAKARKLLVLELARRYGQRFGLFGHGWQGMQCWQGPIPYHMQVETMRRGRVVFGGYPHTSADYYLSDRPFIAIGSGIPFLDFAVPKVDRIFHNNEHWYLYRDRDSLLKLTGDILDADESIILSRASAAAECIRRNHTQYHRMKFAIQTMGMLRAARLAGKRCEVPKIDFLLPGASQSGAIENWNG